MNASFAPAIASTAPSCRDSAIGLAKAGTIIFSIKWCISLPPPPWASVTVGIITDRDGALKSRTL